MIIPKISHDISARFCQYPHIIKHHPGVAATTQHRNPGQTQRNQDTCDSLRLLGKPQTLPSPGNIGSRWRWIGTSRCFMLGNPHPEHRGLHRKMMELTDGEKKHWGKLQLGLSFHNWVYHSINGVIIPWGCHSNNKKNAARPSGHELLWRSPRKSEPRRGSTTSGGTRRTKGLGSVDNIINCSLVGSTTLQNCALHNGIGLPIGYPLVI